MLFVGNPTPPNTRAHINLQLPPRPVVSSVPLPSPPPHLLTYSLLTSRSIMSDIEGEPEIVNQEEAKEEEPVVEETPQEEPAPEPEAEPEPEPAPVEEAPVVPVVT